MCLFSRSSGNAFSFSGGLRFKSQAGQVERSVANGSPPLRHFFERSCVALRNDVEMDPANSLHTLAYKRFDLIGLTKYENGYFYERAYFLLP